jgi:ABC-type glutathione transport system ATPase component
MTPLLAARELTKIYRTRKRELRAVDRVTLEIERGETLAITGRSGSGKSTLAKMLVRLIEPTSGAIAFDGSDITHARPKALLPMRRRVQMLFQDPGGALDPRMTVGAILREPLEIHRKHAGRERERIAELLERVRLPSAYVDRLPHQLSGGERQRVSLARALAVEPELLVLDEPTSALDVLVAKEILSLLGALKALLGLTCVLITHDRRVVARLATRSLALESGRLRL